MTRTMRTKAWVYELVEIDALLTTNFHLDRSQLYDSKQGLKLETIVSLSALATPAFEAEVGMTSLINTLCHVYVMVYQLVPFDS